MNCANYKSRLFSIDKRKKTVGKSLEENEFYGSENLKNAVRMML